MDDVLAGYQAGLIQTFERGRELLASETPEALNWKAPSGGWSAAECLAHLNTTNRLYEKALASTIAEAERKVRKQTKPFQPGWLESWFVGQLEPPAKRRFPAPPAFVPPAALDRETIHREWTELQKHILTWLERADGLDLKGSRVQSPANRWMHFSLGATFALIAAHNRRHLWQATNRLDEYRTATREAASQS